MILLDEEEIARWCNFPYKDSSFLAMSRVVDDLLKAQLKKVSRWGDAYCEFQNRPRRECGHCWQILKDI